MTVICDCYTLLQSKRYCMTPLTIQNETIDDFHFLFLNLNPAALVYIICLCVGFSGIKSPGKLSSTLSTFHTYSLLSDKQSLSPSHITFLEIDNTKFSRAFLTLTLIQEGQYTHSVSVIRLGV